MVINQKVTVDHLRKLIHLLFGWVKYVWREIPFVVHKNATVTSAETEITFKNERTKIIIKTAAGF